MWGRGVNYLGMISISEREEDSTNILVQRLENIDESLLMNTMTIWKLCWLRLCLEWIAASYCVERLYLFCATMTGLNCFESWNAGSNIWAFNMRWKNKSKIQQTKIHYFLFRSPTKSFAQFSVIFVPSKIEEGYRGGHIVHEDSKHLGHNHNNQSIFE